MKVALLTESSADAAAVRVFAREVLGPDTEFVEPELRARGYDSVLANLLSVYKGIHFFRQTEGLIVVVDADHSPPDASDPDSRHRIFTDRLAKLQAEVTAIEDYPKVKTAVGVAASSIEAWLLFPRYTEAEWIRQRELGVHSADEIKRLKVLLYGSDRVPLALETERMVAAAERIISDGQLEALAESYPSGFKPLIAALQAW